MKRILIYLTTLGANISTQIQVALQKCAFLVKQSVNVFLILTEHILICNLEMLCKLLIIRFILQKGSLVQHLLTKDTKRHLMLNKV